MPQLIEHIDAIARKKQRDVLYVTFNLRQLGEEFARIDHYDYNADPLRHQVCQWLTEQGIEWEPCGYVADENSMLSYRGQIYIDVPHDEGNASYQQLQNYFEYPDGSMRLDTAIFWYLPLSVAMRNAHHDEPGFWDRWAENF